MIQTPVRRYFEAKKQVKIRCWWHILIGAIAPWLSTGANIGLVGLYIAYRAIQYHHRHSKGLPDNSHLDIKEFTIAYAISAVIELLG